MSEIQSRSMFEERLDAASQSDDPLVLRNLIGTLVALGGARAMELLATTIGRLLNEGEATFGARRLELWGQAREQVKRLRSRDAELLREALAGPGLAGAAALLDLGGSRQGWLSQFIVQFIGTRESWLRPRFSRLAVASFVGAAAGGLLLWLALVASAIWRGLIGDASEWPGFDLLVSSVLMAGVSVTAVAALIVTGGLPRHRRLWRVAEALVSGAAVALIECGLAFLIPSNSDLRLLLMGETLPFGGGLSLAVAFFVLTLAVGATRMLARELAELSVGESDRTPAWAAAAAVAALLTLAFYLLLPALGAKDFATGLWLVAIPAVFGAGAAAYAVDQRPSRFERATWGAARLAGWFGLAAAAAFAGVLLLLPARAPQAAEQSASERISAGGQVSVAVSPGSRVDVVAVPLRPNYSGINLAIAGGRNLAPPQSASEFEDASSGPALVDGAALIEARRGRLDICVPSARQVSDMPGEPAPCEANSLWWLRSLLGFASAGQAGDTLIRVAPAGRLIRQLSVSASKSTFYFDVARPSQLSASFGSGPSRNDWDAVVRLEQRTQSGGWDVTNMGDDPPELVAQPLEPGRYRICVVRFSTECGTPGPASGNLMVSVLPQPLRSALAR